jgi:hypothetical protein
MNLEKREELYQFLASNWYDRAEDDNEIIKEIIAEERPEHISYCKVLIKEFINSNEPDEEKSKFIRKSVWRYFPEGEIPPLEWLQDILRQLENNS